MREWSIRKLDKPPAPKSWDRLSSITRGNGDADTVNIRYKGARKKKNKKKKKKKKETQGIE